MFKMIAGIIVAFIAITFLAAFMEPMVESIGLGRGSNSLNCPGYVDSSESGTGLPGNTSYNPALESYTSACSTIVLLPFILVAAVIIGVLFGILYGDPTGAAAQPAFR